MRNVFVLIAHLLLSAASYAGTSAEIRLSYFKATPLTDEVRLEWRAEFEKNIVSYTVERSSDGLTFHSICSVNPYDVKEVTKPYHANDEFPFVGRSYYRLKTTDHDGISETSNIVSVTIDIANAGILVYPNPSPTSCFFAKLNFMPDAGDKLLIFSSNGKLLHQQKMNDATQEVRLPGIQAPCVYLVVVTRQGTFRKKVLMEGN